MVLRSSMRPKVSTVIGNRACECDVDDVKAIAKKLSRLLSASTWVWKNVTSKKNVIWPKLRF